MISPAAVRGFGNGFFLSHLWHVLLWPRSSRSIVSFGQVARDGGVEGMSRGEAKGTRKGLTTSLVLRLPMDESCTFFAETLPCPSQLLIHTMIGDVKLSQRALGPVPTTYIRGVPKEFHPRFVFGNQGTSLCCCVHITGIRMSTNSQIEPSRC